MSNNGPNGDVEVLARSDRHPRYGVRYERLCQVQHRPHGRDHPRSECLGRGDYQSRYAEQAAVLRITPREVLQVKAAPIQSRALTSMSGAVRHELLGFPTLPVGQLAVVGT
jgi:hypothetical protein